MSKFYLLSLTENNVKFFKVDHNDIQEIRIENMPHNIDEAVGAKAIEKQLQTHQGASTQEGIHHGHKDDTDFQRNHLETFQRKVDHAVAAYMQGMDEPLMLATVEKTFGLYKQLSTYPNLLTKKFLHGNCDKIKNKELQEKAWEVFKF